MLIPMRNAKKIGADVVDCLTNFNPHQGLEILILLSPCSLWSLAGKDQVEQYLLLSLWHLFGFCSTNVKSFSQLISVFVKSVLSRPIWEGSQYEGDETKRREALRLAMQLRANYIDVELEVSILSNKLRFLVQNVSIGKYHLILLFGSPEPPSLYCFADCSWIQRFHGWKETW